MVSSLFATSLLLSYYFKPEVLEHVWFTGSKGSKASLHVIRVGFPSLIVAVSKEEGVLMRGSRSREATERSRASLPMLSPPHSMGRLGHGGEEAQLVPCRLNRTSHLSLSLQNVASSVNCNPREADRFLPEADFHLPALQGGHIW